MAITTRHWGVKETSMGAEETTRDRTKDRQRTRKRRHKTGDEQREQQGTEWDLQQEKKG